MTTPVELSEDQVLYFRARRAHLAGPGAPDATAAARAMLGAQSQQLPPSLLALALRTAGHPTVTDIEMLLLSAPPKLVRTWGQRDTLHIYDPTAHWARIVAARDEWRPQGRGGPMPSAATLERAFAVLQAAPSPVTRSDLIDIAPQSYVRAVEERARAAGMDARRLAASRLIWRLAQRGDACVADKRRREQTYAARSAWFPELAWNLEPARDAATALSRAYLATYGPATAADVAHFFGARVSEARAWLAELGGELAEVRCGDRRGLVTLGSDLDTLKTKPPSGTREWPLRLLPLWESTLMGHADKSWTVPLEAERTLIWRKAGFVAAVVLARGRVVATWSHTAKRRRLLVEVLPLSGWREARHAPSVRREAKAMAAHLELADAEVTIGRAHAP